MTKEKWEVAKKEQEKINLEMSIESNKEDIRRLMREIRSDARRLYELGYDIETIKNLVRL